MAERKLPTDIRQEQIVAAALQIMGSSTTTRLHIQDIARHMGLATSALYRHFKNRDALLSAVLEHIRTKLHRNLEIVRQTTDDPVERLHEMLQLHTRLIREEQGIPRILFSDELWGQKQERRQKMYRIATGYLAEIEDMVRTGQTQGRIRRDIPPAAVARMFFGIVQPAALLWHMSEGSFDLEDHIALTWPLFRETITPDFSGIRVNQF